MSLKRSASVFRTSLLSCTRVFSPAIDALPCSGLFVAIAFLLMCGSIANAQENGTSSPTAPFHSGSTAASRKKADTASPQSIPTETITFNVFSTAFTSGGLGFYGFAMDPVTGYYYARAGYGGSGSVSIYPGPAALATNTPSSTVVLANGGFQGTYFTVQNGVLFGRADTNTSAISSWNTVTGAIISSSVIPNMCGTNGSCTFNWGGYSGVNWMQDSTGLYVLGVDDSMSEWQVNLMNTDLSVATTQFISPVNNELGYGFFIKGQLFTGDSYDATTITSDFNVQTGVDQAVSYTLTGIGSGLEWIPYYFSNAFYDPTIDRVYIWNTSNGILYSADNASQQFELSVLNFGAVNVATAAPTQTVTYNFTSPTTLSAVKILTEGASGLDYTDGGGSTCTAGTAYGAGQSCAVTVAFTPSVPGLRSGAVTLFAQGSNLALMTFYLSGIGQSGAVTMDPGTQSTIATLSSGGQGYGSAMDGSGNVYVVDHINSQVMKLAAGSFTQSVVVASGLSAPTAVALDGAGNLYISDTGNARVAMVPNENGTLNSGDMSTVNITGLGSPLGLAVNAVGNLFVVDGANGDVVTVQAGGGTPTTLASGLTSPNGVAVDATGNVYVTANNAVTEYPFGGGLPIPMGSGYANPNGVAVDPSGAVFVADAGNARIVWVAVGGATQVNLPVTGITNPQGVTLDGAGNVYVTDSGNVLEINRTQAAALLFASTSIGSTSTSQPVTVSNSGNQLLTASNLAITANFTQVPSGGSDCTLSTQLSSSGQCFIALAFAPTASGTLLGTVTLTDNALNNSASAQAVQLSGSGSQVAQTITFGALLNQPLGTAPFIISATASSGLAVNFASTTSAVCTVSSATVTLVSAGTCTIQATQAGNANYAAATPVSQSFQASDFTLTSSPPSMSIKAGQPGTFTLTLTPQGSFTNAITLSCGTLPELATCTFTPSATVTPNGNTATATLNITTTAHTTASALVPSQSSSLPAVWLLLPAMFLGTVGMARPKGRKLLSLCLLFMLVGGCLFQAACGGVSTPAVNTSTGTPAGTYSVIVTGTAGSDQHTTTIRLTLN
jgi:sugar lactone lactonase YvrE